MRYLSSVISVALVLLVCLGSTFALDPYQVNVTLPTVGQNFVAGEKLPLVYRISANSSASTIQLSISLVNPRNASQDVLINANADISQGYSQQVKLNDGTIVYEHQENYDIPLTTAPGEYNVVFTNTLNGINTTIPIAISQAAQSSQTKPSATGVGGGGGSMWGDGGNSLFMSPPWISSGILAVLSCAALFL